MSFWNSLKIGASGLTAQRLRLDVISNNIANANTTHTAQGGPYQRQDVVFSSGATPSFLPLLLAADSGQSANNPQLVSSGVQVSKIVTDTTPGAQVYDPHNPDANTQGFVTYPNVDLATEMTNMVSATRSYEANLAAIEAVKHMAVQALDIGTK
jgi:flagellar basal-body rod protein FlgC